MPSNTSTLVSGVSCVKTFEGEYNLRKGMGCPLFEGEKEKKKKTYHNRINRSPITNRNDYLLWRSGTFCVQLGDNSNHVKKSHSPTMHTCIYHRVFHNSSLHVPECNFHVRSKWVMANVSMTRGRV